jgi:secretion/DNA translocation related TadE-like protein
VTAAAGHLSRQRGSASILMAGLMGVLVLLTSVALLVAGYETAQHRARGAADLSAVSGAAAFASGRDACDEAGRTARDNGASLLSCSTAGDFVDYVVSVRVSVPVHARIRGLPDRVVSGAHAGSPP